MKKITYIIVVFSLIGIFFMLNKNNNNISLEKVIINNNKKSNVTFAMYKENNEGEYVEITEFPDDEYELNKEKTICVDLDGEKSEDTINYDYDNKIIILDSSKSVKCYLYFKYSLLRIFIGSYDSRSNYTVDVKNYTNKYNELTVDNFYMSNVRQLRGGSSCSDILSYIIQSYDPSTGLLSLVNSQGYSSNYCFSVGYDIYAFINLKPEKIINLGSYSSLGNNSINILNSSSICEKRTVNNFYIKNASQRWVESTYGNAGSIVFGSYDQNLCELSLLKATQQQYNNYSGKTWSFYVSYDAHLIDASIATID